MHLTLKCFRKYVYLCVKMMMHMLKFGRLDKVYIGVLLTSLLNSLTIVV